VNSASHALTRRWALELSPARFRQLAIAAVAMLILIVGTGATVRLTGSGLGCEHWPGCQPGDPFPKKGYHSYIEFSNRVVAFFTVLTTLALAVGALRTRGLARPGKVLAWIVFVATLAQAPLGAITVYFHLNPYLVIAHLLLSLAAIGVAVLVLSLINS
jgi:cytochrome c oxidase assembly protein subunit 15